MATSSHELRARLVDYAWSAWSCLGVAGWSKSSFAGCIDIDALVLMTGRLGDTDARLRDESIDWCVSNIALVARSRLAHLLRGDETNPSWAAYAATLQSATKQRWPGAGTAFDWTASRKSRVPDRADGSTLALRCRALLGATARGEVVRILLLEEGNRALDARDLAVEAAYTKRSISEALENLRIAGLVVATSAGNSLRFHFQRRVEIEALLGPLPEIRTSQRAFCRVLWAILRASEEAADTSARIRLVEGARLVRELEPEMRRIDPDAVVLGGEPPSLDVLLDWCIATFDAHFGAGLPPH